MSDNNAEKAGGTFQKIKGKVKEGVGNLIDDPAMANEGRAEQVVGHERVEDAKTAERGKGTIEEVGGKIKGAAGTLIDDEQLEAEGKADELKGKARRATNQ